MLVLIFVHEICLLQDFNCPPSPPCPTKTFLPRNCNYDLAWKKDLWGVIKLRISCWDHPRIPRWALNPMTNILITHRREDTDRGQGIPCDDDTGGTWRETAADYWEPAEKAERGEERFSQTLKRECGPTSTLMRGFRPPELWEDIFLPF